MQATASAPQIAPTAPIARQAPTATEMYEAARLSRQELRHQQDDLQGERRQLQRELTAAQNPADKKGLEGRLISLDGRIADVEKQLASADALVANRAAIPGVIVNPPSPSDNVPPEVFVLGGLSMLMVVLLPISIGYARRLWRRGAAQTPALPADLGDRFANMERGIEAVAIEVERLGEGQRFVTQLLSENDRRQQQQALPVNRER